MINNDSWIFNKPIAHRGLHNEQFPENSAGAFDNAIAHGFPIEMDVHMLADGALIVFHDDNLKRMTGDGRDIESITLAEAKTLRLAGSNYGLPTMEEFLSLVSGRVPLLIEIKNSGKVGALEQKLIDLLSGYKGEYAVQTFNPNSLAYFKANAPKVPRILLSCDFGKDTDLAFFKKFVLRHLFLLKKSGAQVINYDIRQLPRRRATKSGLPIMCWTVRSQADYEQSKAVARNVIFENFIPS